MKNKVYQDFLLPANDYRSRPFWAWNGSLAEEELLRQIRTFQDMGFGGFFMHSRTGLNTEYLGEEWFRLTKRCIQEGKKLGLQPWIYDEDRWPSGSAGGKVTREEAFRRKYLTLSFEVGEEAPLAIFAGKVEGLALEPGWRRVETPREKRPEETLLVFTVHTMQPQSTYNGFTDVDRLNLAATERFLEVTHQQYREQCGEDFSDILGVFTDEPHRGMVFSEFSDAGEDKNWSLPWTDDLPQAFFDAFGTDLTQQLPALYLQEGGEPVAKVKWQYMELLQRLLIQRFLQPIQAWAKENGIKTTGHFLHEDSLMAQAVPCGSMMRCYPFLDEPGIDSLTETRFTPWAVKALESAARQMGKQWKLSELFGATGWQMSFADYKYVGDWQTILGINVRCPHLSWYTMKGEAKRDYPGSFLHQATWYREYDALETYFARLAVASTTGKPVCDTLVIHPVESLWCQIHPGWVKGMDSVTPAIKRLERDFSRTFNYLMQAQKDFDYGDEGLLAEYASVENGILRVGQMEYRQVVISGCLNIRFATYQLLKTFREQGGRLVFIGIPPRFVDCEKTQLCRSLAQKSLRIPLNQKSVISFFREQETAVQIADQNAAKNFYLQLRETEDSLTAVLWNKSRSRVYENLSIRVPETEEVQLWDCFSGEKTALTVHNGSVFLDFAPGQERVLHFGKTEGLPIREKKEKTWKALGQPVDFSLDEPNVYVLDIASLWLEDKKLAEYSEILELDQALRRKLGYPLRGGEMLQPWAMEKKTFSRKSIRLMYSVSMEQVPWEPMLLAMEPMEDMTLTINGESVPLKPIDRFWIDNCYRLYEIPADLWQSGTNALELTAGYAEESGLEAMYLLGQFGVYFQGRMPVIGPIPRELKIGDIVYQGLPFYSGKVTYAFPLPDDKPAFIRLPQMGGSCAIVSRGEQRKMIPWTWETPAMKAGVDVIKIQVVLNRRNTFGPLHHFPVKQPFVAPECFVCDDLRYALYPMGLLQAPQTAPYGGE